uniref:snRNA-activating protein complex subunit 4 n=1 Tax=Lygus hesperus TaxID=30085 RepID=A0A0A9X1D7_LYGHE
MEEDLRLLLSVRAYISPDVQAIRHGVVDSVYNSWIEISQHVPGRSDVSCRERLMRAYDIFYSESNRSAAAHCADSQEGVKNSVLEHTDVSDDVDGQGSQESEWEPGREQEQEQQQQQEQETTVESPTGSTFVLQIETTEYQIPSYDRG